MANPQIVVIGGTNLDVIGTPHQALIAQDSNPGHVHQSAGGVGRNVAENLARLGVPVSFLTVLGNDETGQKIGEDLRMLGVDLITAESETTSTYLAVNHLDGSMAYAISDMANVSKLDAVFLSKHKTRIATADLVFADPNLNEAALQMVFRTAKTVFVDGVSPHKVIKIRPFLSQIDTLKLNLDELEVLSGRICDTRDKQHDAILDILNQGVKRVAVTLGAVGALLATKDHTTFHRPSQSKVVNTTGAGDAFMAGLIYAHTQKTAPLETAVILAGIALESLATVNPTLSEGVLLHKLRQ